MQVHEWQALGTHWCVSVDSAAVDELLWLQLEQESASFEKNFSRFIPDSQVNEFRFAAPGTYPISSELACLLQAADRVRQATNGVHDPCVATLLEKVGYNSAYSFSQTDHSIWQKSEWQVHHNTITITSPVVFDLGGTAKGYWIDQLARLLSQAGEQFFLIDGGGDMFGTTKADGRGWRVALEWPGQPDIAVGVAELVNQGLAVSDVFRRKWKEWHHLLNPHTAQPIQIIAGCMAIAPTAWLADQLTAGLAVVPNSVTAKTARAISQEFSQECSYAVFYSDKTAHISENWPVQLL